MQFDRRQWNRPPLVLGPSLELGHGGQTGRGGVQAGFVNGKGCQSVVQALAFPRKGEGTTSVVIVIVIVSIVSIVVVVGFGGLVLNWMVLIVVWSGTKGIPAKLDTGSLKCRLTFWQSSSLKPWQSSNS